MFFVWVVKGVRGFFSFFEGFRSFMSKVRLVKLDVILFVLGWSEVSFVR